MTTKTTNNNPAMRQGFLDTNVATEQFQALINSMPDSVVAVDEQGKIIAINFEAERRLGYTIKQLLGNSVEVLLPAALKQEHCAYREQYMANPETRPMGAARNLSVQCADGSCLSVDISLSPLMVAGKKIVLAAIRDVSERRAAEESIRRLNEELEARVRQRTAELEAANRQLEAYSYTVSHELRAPLRVVRGFSRLLDEEMGHDADAWARGYLQRISTAAQRMGEIVDGLLALARLDHHQLHSTQVDMTALAQSVVDEVRAEDPARVVNFVVDQLPMTDGDVVLLRQVFANLLSNAVKFCGSCAVTSITVRGYRESNESDRCIYQVQDNGPGFDAQLADKLFDPFHRLEGADEFDGLGIGLTLVRRIIERHAGRIWAEGRVGSGATFSFWLPVK